MQLSQFLRESVLNAEVIFVDDGSTDNTAELVQSHLCSFDNSVLLTSRHGGKARSVLGGLAKATGDIVGFMDADLATPLPTLFPVIGRLLTSTDVVIGSREGEGAQRVGEPGYRHFMGRVFNTIVRLSLLPGINDTQCGFKFMTRAARDRILPKVRLYADDAELQLPQVTAFDVELLYIARQLGLEVSVVPVTWAYGTHSKVNPVRDTLQNLRDVLRVWINGKRGYYTS